MSAILGASGPDFDVDAFIRESEWQGSMIYHRGDPIFPTKPLGRQRTDSGLNLAVSKASFHEFFKQIQDAISFLTECAPEVIRLVQYPGVTGVELDFGVAWQDVAAQSDCLPAPLVKLAGSCGISLKVSHYPIGDENPET